MKVPILHRHAASGQAYVRVTGAKPVYFGKWPEGHKAAPPDVDRAYREWLAEWLRQNAPAVATGRPAPIHAASVGELWERYCAYCRVYYRKGGRETSEVGVLIRTMRIVCRLFGALPAERFTSAELLECRDEMIRRGWTRESINKQVMRVRKMFRWAARPTGGKLIPTTVYHELREVEGLISGRCGVPDGPGREPVAMTVVRATLAQCSATVADMVDVHYLLACRSQDVCRMRPCDIDRAADPKDGLWLYMPESSKSEHHLKGSKAQREAERLTYWIGPTAQAILLPLILKAGGDDSARWLFPSRRRGGVWQCWTSCSYAHHVARAAREAGLPHWSPYQLRHTRLTEAGEDLGTEKAQRLAGHKRLATAEIYAHKTQEERRRIALDMEKRDARGRASG